MKHHPSTPDRAASPGRPRDPRIEREVLRATAELVRERGYADVTISAIAERAGTTKPAVYRRWASKAHLVREAAFPADDATSLPRTGTFAEDLREMIRRTARVFSAPVARAALPGLVAELAADPTIHAAMLERFADGLWGALEERLAEAVVAGEVRADLTSTTLVEALAGTVLMALLMHTSDDLDDEWVERTATLLTKGIAP
jgi:AcrR family transcriptional regulator